MKLYHLCFLFILLTLFYCSPKVVKKTATVEYNEDLSSVRPPLDTVDDQEEEILAKTPYVAPRSHVTGQMNALVDSLSKDNLDKKVKIYTIQVYVGNSREEANEIRSKIYKIVEDETPRLEYSQPNYRVKVGRYVDRLDAHKTLAKLKGQFPGSILVNEFVKPSSLQ